MAARTFAVALAVVQAASNVIHGAGSWTGKPPAGTPVDSTQPLASGLVGAWHFDQGPVPQNLANSLVSGAYQGSPAFQPTQDGMSFVATSDANFLQVADPGQTLNFTSGPATVGVDFYYGSAAPGAVLVGRDRVLVDGYDIRIVNDGVGLSVATELNHGGTSDVIKTGPVLTVGAVNRVLVTYSGSVATIYVNGVSSASGAYTAPSLGSVDVFVGRDPTIGGQFFNNPITRLLMWNRQLTPGEAAQVTQSDPYAYMAAPTATQPAIFDVALGSSTPNSAVITWSTNVLADSLVQFGPTTAYGSSTTLDATPTTAHSVLISNLSASQLYHYQVVSKDANGEMVASPDSTFTPLGGMEFTDEFVGSTLNPSSWIALNRPGKSGEAEYYLPSNAGVGGGLLGLTSRVDSSVLGYNYTSAMLQWPTLNFLYGSVEIRAKLPGGKGPWPGLRLLGANCQQTNITTPDNTGPCNWPQPGSDEIVIAEVANNNPLAVNQQIHSGNLSPGCQAPVTDASQNWHTYGLVWTATSVVWKIDGAATCTVTTGVPATPMFVVLDVALANGAIDDTTLPQTAAVDYVRVSQQTDTTPPIVTGVSPAGGALAVPTSTTVTATFNEPMTSASITGSILLSQNGTAVPASVGYNASTRTATLTPLAPLANLTTYTATVKSGPAGVADLAGNTMPGNDVTWAFTTAPGAPPLITSLSPSSGSAGTPVTIAGANFGSAQSTSTVTFNGAPAVPVSWTSASIVTSVPVGATSGPVVVTVGGIAGMGLNFNVTVPAPFLTDITPSFGGAGTPVSISGSDLVGGLFVGKTGSWGPFQSGVMPTNFIGDAPDGNFVGNPVFTSDGGGAFTSTATDFLDIPDGGSGGTYDWTKGGFSAQIDFQFPALPVFPPEGVVLLATKGSFGDGTGWELEINNTAFQGKYQIELETNHGVGSSTLVRTYQIVPGAFHRALIVCDGNGVATWYVNGVASAPAACVAPSSASTDLFIGRYSGPAAFAANFPISRVQIWNRPLTPAEAITSTTMDPSPSPTAVSFNGTPAAATRVSGGHVETAVPVGATTGPVSVTVGGQQSNGLAFTLPDTAPPSVIAMTPASNATNVPIATTVTATFSEALDVSTISAAAMFLTGPGGPVAASLSYDATSHLATLTPAAALANATTYTVTLPAGTGGVTDLAGNPLASDVTWNFTTIANTTPPVISLVKASPGSNTAVITWTTDKPSTSRVDYGTSAQSLTLNSVDATLATAHSLVLSGLSAKTTYYFRVTSIDAAANSASAPPTGSAAASVVTNPAGLVAAFGFNEGTGNTVADSSNTGNNGTVTGATWTAGGRYGKALSFDGATASITIAEAPSLDLTTGMTIEAWVKPVSLNGWQTVIYKERPVDGGTSIAWSLYSTDNTAPPAVYGMLAGAVGNNQWTHATGASMLPLNTWSHLAGTFDGTSLRLYVNGTLVKTLSLPGSLVVTPGPLRIGGHSAIPQFFNGLIDEVRVYNRALSKAEIQSDMNSPLP